MLLYSYTDSDTSLSSSFGNNTYSVATTDTDNSSTSVVTDNNYNTFELSSIIKARAKC